MGYILIIAVLLRLILINQSLWLDESIQALALMGKMGPLLSYALADYQPPLYHFIGYLFTQLFGSSEIVLRLPSLISGVMTVFFVIKIGELMGSRKLGLIAGLLAATNPLLIYYSQEGRTYAMTCFFVTASFYYFLQLLKQKNIPSSILYALFTLLFLWTSYLSWFSLLAQGLYVIWKKRFDILAIQAGVALTLLAWLPSFITPLGIGQSTRAGSPEWGAVVGGLSWKSFPLTWVKFSIGRIGFDNKLLYAVLVGVLAMLHIFILKTVNYKKYHFLLVWLIPPVFLGIATATILPIYQYFRVLFVLPAYLILLALGLSNSKSKIILFAVVATQLLSLGYFWANPRYHREEWRELVKELPSDVTLAMPSRAQSAPLRYYAITEQIIEPSHEPISGDTIYYIRYAEDLFDVSKLGEANFASSGYTITTQKTYPGIQVDIYSK